MSRRGRRLGRLVLHTVGPVVASASPSEKDRALLTDCYDACLRAATEHGLSTVGLCCVSTGIFGFPQREAAEIALRAAIDHLRHVDGRLKVVLDVFLDSDERIYRDLLACAPR